MTQVHISGPSHTVTVNHDGADLGYVIEKAQKLWQDTMQPEPPPGPGYGFTSQLAPQWDHDRKRPVRASESGPTHG